MGFSRHRLFDAYAASWSRISILEVAYEEYRDRPGEEPAKEQYGEKFCNNLISMRMGFSMPGCGSTQSLHFLIDVGVEVGKRIGG